MLAGKKIEEMMGRLLLLGILLATTLVLIGGTLFLWQNGQQDIAILPLINHNHFAELWQLAFSFTPLGMIELGLLILVLTQLLRVALLCSFYIATRDYWFSIISLFILSILIYSILN